MPKELAYIICLLVGQSPHHLKNTQHFVQHIQKTRLEPGEVMTSYDVKALFTSVPVDPSIQIVKPKLLQDPTLPKRTNMSIQDNATLLEFCLKNTYFLFEGYKIIVPLQFFMVNDFFWSLFVSTKPSSWLCISLHVVLWFYEKITSWHNKCLMLSSLLCTLICWNCFIFWSHLKLLFIGS